MKNFRTPSRSAPRTDRRTSRRSAPRSDQQWSPVGMSDSAPVQDKKPAKKGKKPFSLQSAPASRADQGERKRHAGAGADRFQGSGKSRTYGQEGRKLAYPARKTGAPSPITKIKPVKSVGKPAGKNQKRAHHVQPQAAHAAMPQVAQGTVLLWGLHAVAAAWLNPSRVCTQLFVTEAGEKALRPTLDEGKARGLTRPDLQTVERYDLDRLTPPSSVHQGIVCAVVPLTELDLHDVIGVEAVPDVVVVLDQVTDPHNVGAILRSAAAFGAGAVVMTERNAPAATGVLAKSASGALEVVPLVHVVNLSRALEDLREAGYWCVGLAEEGERRLDQLDLSARTAIVLGAEGDGLRHLTRQKCDELAHLPTSPELGSLNVSNAAAVALYEIRRQK